MKEQSSIIQQLRDFKAGKKCVKVKRQVGTDGFKHTRGYILKNSKQLVLLEETDDFEALGYLVFPLSSLVSVRFNNNDRYYDKIMRWEGEIDKIRDRHNVDITDWPSLFRSVRKSGFCVIIECEDPDDETFDIGPITRVTKTAVYVRYFNAKGFLEEEPTRIPWNKITLVRFDDRYANVFSKYLRKRKPEK